VKVILLSCARAEDILHENAECANRIRPSAMHVIILPTDPVTSSRTMVWTKENATTNAGYVQDACCWGKWGVTGRRLTTATRLSLDAELSDKERK